MIASAGGVVHALLTHLWSVQGRADGKRRRLAVLPGRSTSPCATDTSGGCVGVAVCGRRSRTAAAVAMDEDNLWFGRLSGRLSSAVPTLGYHLDPHSFEPEGSPGEREASAVCCTDGSRSRRPRRARSEYVDCLHLLRTNRTRRLAAVK